MKHKTVEVIGYEFDSLPGHTRITGRGSGATVRVALQRAVGNLFSKLRGKHIDSFKLAVVVRTVSKPEPDATVRPIDNVADSLKKAGNCGDCLMEHAEIVPLAADRSCACCASGHKLAGHWQAVRA
jgi:hypothetical protein